MLAALASMEREDAAAQGEADPHAGHNHASPSGSSAETSGSGQGASGGMSAMDRLAAIEAMLEGGEEHDLQPTQITAFLVGMHERADAVFLQRAINTYRGEALTAVMPGVALQELWQVVGVVEKTLLVVSVFVVAVSLAGMLSALMTSLNERRREMAILRSVGARPFHIVSLIVGEAVAVTALACVLGVAILYLLLALARPVILAKAGLHLGFSLLSGGELLLIVAVLLVGLLVGLLPAWRCYRNSLADGLTVKV
jgi:putative ABC transport system permease protein